MLSYFRIHDPYRVVGLFAFLVLVYLPLLIDPPAITYPELKNQIIGTKVLQGATPYTQLIDNVAPLAAFFHAAVQFVFGESLVARHLLALAIIFTQAIFIGIVYIDKKVYPENSFIPSLIFGLLYLFSFDSLSLSGELLGSFFILLALNSLFKELEFREESLEMVLKIGVFIGIASLFAFSFIVFVPGTLIILLLFTRSSGRKFSLLITGFIIPHFLLVAIYSIHNGIGDLWNYFYLANLSFSSHKFVTWSSLLPFLGLPAFFLIASLLMVNRETRYTKYQSQILQAMFFWMIFAILQVMYTKDFRPQTFILLIPGFSFFIAHLFLLLKRRWFAEGAFWIFVIGLLIGCYYSRYIAEEDNLFEDLLVKNYDGGISNQKVVILGDDLSIYNRNLMCTQFLNWKLSKEIFEHPEYYQNTIKVYKGFIADPPDLIIDPADLMRPFLKKIPDLNVRYYRVENGYKRKSLPSN